MSKPRRVVSTLESLVLGVALTVIAMLLFSGRSITLAAGPWYVDGASGDNSNSCLSAVAACETVGGAIAKASPGDTIHIAAGVYTENLDLENLTLIGAGMEDTILDGNQAKRVLTVTQVVNLTKLSVRNGYASDPYFFKRAGGGIFKEDDDRFQVDIFNPDPVSIAASGSSGVI